MSSSRRSPRPGAALLEVLVATVILSVAGVAAVSMARQAAESVRRAREADERTRAANAFFAVASLWTRQDLDRHLGDRLQGPWRMRVDRTLPTLYDVTLTDTLSGVELLRTTLYRPVPRDAR